MIVFTTLAEKDYFLGASALINSIIRNGSYGNKMIIGYRGALPTWLPNMTITKNGKSFFLDNGKFQVELVELIGSLHMVHEKPKWFKYLTEVLEPNAEEYFFFDSDIVIINRMSFFGEWVKQGVALCEDVNFDMSVDHPIRKQWSNIAEDAGLSTKRELSRYYNSGFLGWSKESVRFVSDWDNCFTLLSKRSGDMTRFRVHDRTNVVLSANQDSLNLAAMTTEMNLSTIGPEAMGFHHGLPLMAHPLGEKPWVRNFMKDFLSGYAPRPSDILFWENVNNGELKPFKDSFVKQRINFCKFLRGCARFYRRS